MARGCYETLNVPPDASEVDIRRAYRRLALRHHPDKNAGSQQAQEAFSEVQSAYAILSDRSKRAAYDARRSQSADFTKAAFGMQSVPGEAEPPPPPPSYSDLSAEEADDLGAMQQSRTRAIARGCSCVLFGTILTYYGVCTLLPSLSGYAVTTSLAVGFRLSWELLPLEELGDGLRAMPESQKRAIVRGCGYVFFSTVLAYYGVCTLLPSFAEYAVTIALAVGLRLGWDEFRKALHEAAT